MLELLKVIDFEQLLTAAAFIVFLLIENRKLSSKLDKSEEEKAQYIDRYINDKTKNSADLMEATRVFNELAKVIKS
jgi:hypothetical protein